jgi:hypothetical protein
LRYVWNWFCELASGLAVTGMAPSVVTWEGLESWARQMGVDLEPREARTLVRLGQKRAEILSEEKPKAPPPN